jgi:hypothetical protein
VAKASSSGRAIVFSTCVGFELGYGTRTPTNGMSRVGRKASGRRAALIVPSTTMDSSSMKVVMGR